MTEVPSFHISPSSCTYKALQRNLLQAVCFTEPDQIVHHVNHDRNARSNLEYISHGLVIHVDQLYIPLSERVLAEAFQVVDSSALNLT
jgi:hypothetical protein